MRSYDHNFASLANVSQADLEKELYFAVKAEHDDITRAWTQHIRDEIHRRSGLLREPDARKSAD